MARRIGPMTCVNYSHDTYPIDVSQRGGPKGPPWGAIGHVLGDGKKGCVDKPTLPACCRVPVFSASAWLEGGRTRVGPTRSAAPSHGPHQVGSRKESQYPAAKSKDSKSIADGPQVVALTDCLLPLGRIDGKE